MKFLIVGLGNPGEQYLNTRHNIGFKVLEHVAKQADAFFTEEKYGDLCSFKYKGKHVFLLKPNTFMNLSGKAVSFWLKKEKILNQNLLIITDDINLPLGTLRMKNKGSDGGHNGLRSTQENLSTTKYPRLRIGIGNDFVKGKQVDYVLGKWLMDESILIEKKLKTINEMILSFCFNGLLNTMNNFNNT